jgi:competence protein CoiA
MNMKSLLQSFALDKNGQMRSVDEVARGLACDCTCPHCGEPVIARQGDIREWHFAHASGTECDQAAESALHFAAKQLLLETGGITLPEAIIHSNVTLPDGRTGHGSAGRPPVWIDFDAVEAEKKIGNIRPDIYATIGPTIMLIEVAVTHFADEQKRRELIALKAPAVEIDLAGLAREKWDWDSLREAVIDGVDCKEWIHILDHMALESEAKEDALRMALETPIPLPTAAEDNGFQRTRYRVGGIFVYVSEYPFGLTIWTPYNPDFNERVKTLVRHLGGTWQPKFKNWLVPPGAKPHLLRELHQWSGNGPEIIN